MSVLPIGRAQEIGRFLSRFGPSGLGVTLAGLCDFKRSWDQTLADVEADGGKPYAIPAGASEHELGGLGFARWAKAKRRRRAFQPARRPRNQATRKEGVEIDELERAAAAA